MKNKIIYFILFLVLSNIPPLRFIYKVAFDKTFYKYSNADASFTVQDYLGKEHSGIYSIRSGFSNYLQKYPSTKNKILYRLFWRNPLCFWRWAEYIFVDEYKLPYKNWQEIEKVRLPYKSNKYQDF